MLPKRLASQMILLLLITVFSTVLLIFTIFIIETDDNDVVTEKVYGNHYLERMAAAIKLMENQGTEHQLHTLASYRVQVLMKDEPLFDTSLMSKADYIRTEKLRTEVGPAHPETYLRQLRPMESRFDAALMYFKDQILGTTLKEHIENKENTILEMQSQLADGRWLSLFVLDKTAYPSWIKYALAPTAIFTLIFLILAVIVVKRITSPLAELADKANKLGKGHAIQAIVTRGPEDVQNAIVAFNTMRTRLLNVNDHRARALAAISHDIRTPLTSIRLIAEYIGEQDVQRKIFDKVSEMEQICEATVTFALKDSWSEKNKSIDIVSLVESLCCDLSEQGLDVSFEAKGIIPYPGRPVALKRALINLIKNGVEYGKRVDVDIQQTKEAVEIYIRDEGPGIANNDKERLFEPFERAEKSRNRSSGGLGLGLAISRSVIRSHGGEIELNNNPVSGLDVVVVLPL